MTRKDYIRFAKIIKDNEVGIVGTNEFYLNKDRLIDDLIDWFESDNYLFDRNKFIEACE